MPRGQGETILHVEDEWPVREVTEELFVELNYNSFTAADGDEALRLHETHGHGIAAVISDVIMPGMGRADLCRQIRARNARMPIMLTSGHPMEAHATELSGLKVDRWLMKPASPGKLARQMAQAVSAVPGR